MKVCPTCDTTFNDDSLMFCLHDGAQLIAGEGTPTVVIIPQSASGRTAPSVPTAAVYVPPPKKSNTPLIVVLTVVVTVILIAAVAGILWLFLSNRGDAANGNRNGVNASPTPKPSATPKPSPSTTATPAASPITKQTPAKQESDEVTPINWNTSGAGFKNDVGMTYKFECPENGTAGTIWGSDTYTDDSSICTAAVHAGVITLERGGTVTVEFRPGKQIYGSTTRNGITSNTYGERARSFVVR